MFYKTKLHHLTRHICNFRSLCHCCSLRGYYPKGGGEVIVTVQPVSQLKAVEMVDPGSVIKITGTAFVAGVLPVKVRFV